MWFDVDEDLLKRGSWYSLLEDQVNGIEDLSRGFHHVQTVRILSPQSESDMEIEFRDSGGSVIWSQEQGGEELALKLAARLEDERKKKKLLEFYL